MTKKVYYAFLLISCAGIFFSSCKRNKECDAVVNVVDANNAPVSGATVHIYPTQTAPQGNLSTQDQTGTTDASGSISFHFKVPAILEADATSGSMKGNALVKLAEGKRVSQTVKIY